jgi:spore coat protein U-like protein
MILAAVLAAGLPALAGQAQAQSCSFAMSTIDFGAANLIKGGNLTTSGTFSATCSGLPNQTISICANFGTGSGGAAAGGSPRYLKSGSSVIEYDILRNVGAGQIWGSYLWGNPDPPPTMSVALGANGQGTLSQTVNARMNTNQPVALVGLHTSSFSGNNAMIDFGYSSSFTCGPTLSSRAQQAPFTVQMNNQASCTLAATGISFGSVANLSAVLDATGTITLTCTKNTRYDLGLSNGSGGGTAPQSRRMTNPATSSYVTYGIYRDAARNQPWGGTAGTNTVAGRGTGRPVNLTTYGRVPVQVDPPADTYSDTIIATITY